jgi:hypothetical protein
LQDAVLHCRQRIGDDTIAFNDLATAINDYDVHCKIEQLDRSIHPPKKIELVLPRDFFRRDCEAVPTHFGITIRTRSGVRTSSNKYGLIYHLVGPFKFYAWGPDLERLWPSRAPTQEVRRRGPLPREEWWTICGEIARRCIPAGTRIALPGRSENDLAEQVAGWCGEQGFGDPAVSDMREAVKRVFTALRTPEK